MKTPIEWMQIAYDQAFQIDPHKTAPNPRVSCLVVKDDQVIASGCHERCGDAHAEANALSQVDSLEDCDVYITLEPCDHFVGKQTGSCTELLLKKNPRLCPPKPWRRLGMSFRHSICKYRSSAHKDHTGKIYVGALDPTFQGKNIETIRSAGIDIEVLDFGTENRRLNPFFPRKKRPYVCLKIGQTLDGIINIDDQSYSNGKKYLTNEKSRQRVHEMRAAYSAVLTTTETVLRDDPRLDLRLEKFDRVYSDPAVIVLGDRVIPPHRKVWQIPDRTIQIFPRKNLETTLSELWNLHRIDSVLVEAGPTFTAELLKANLVDEIQLFIAPFIAGKGKSLANQFFDLNDFQLSDQGTFAEDGWLKYKKSRRSDFT